MRSLSTLFLLVFLARASSQRQSSKQSADLTTAEKFFNGVHTVVHDLKESEMLKKKAAMDTVRTITRTKYGVLRDLKNTDNKIAGTFLDVELAKLEAIKAVKLALLNMLSVQIDALMNEIQSNDVSDLLDSPIFEFFAEMLVPLFSGRNGEDMWEKVTGTNYSPDSEHSDDARLHENQGIPVIRKSRAKNSYVEDNGAIV